MFNYTYCANLNNFLPNLVLNRKFKRQKISFRHKQEKLYINIVKKIVLLNEGFY
jgi:hypothetical protein